MDKQANSQYHKEGLSMEKSHQARLDSHLRAFKSLRRNDEQDQSFLSRLNQLQRWQMVRMRDHCLPVCEDRMEVELMDFILAELYIGMDLTQLGKRFDSLIHLASKFVKNPELLCLSMELNSLTASMEDRLTEILFEEMKVAEINHENYRQAHHIGQFKEQKYRQIDLVLELCQDMDTNTKSKFVYSTFKLAKMPAKLGGLGDFYDVIWRGFLAMRRIKSPESVINKLMEAERTYVDGIFEDNRQVASR